MPLLARSSPDRHVFQLIGGTLVGAALAAAGLGVAFLALRTPVVTNLVPATRAGNPVAIAMLVWALTLIAGGGLLVSGANRLAAVIASVRSNASRLSPVVRAMGRMPEDIVVALGVVPRDGRAIPELVVGPFGVAVVHAATEEVRRVGTSWEARTREGWVPTENPVDRVARDADRVRHWLTEGDLDFVVRVYAALVTVDASIPRSPVCAVIAPDQIPDWIAALPRQRSLSAGRRHHLLTRIQGSIADEAAGRTR